MMQEDFLKKLLNYPKEDLTEKHIKSLAPLLENPKFNKQHLIGINKVASNMAAWVIAMESFYKVNLIVKPKQLQLGIALAKFEEVSGVLKVKQASLKEVQNKVANLKRSL
jgi:dynein heavy chain